MGGTDRRFRAHIVRPVLAYVRARGGDPAEVLRNAGVAAEAEHAASVELPLARLGKLLELAAEAAGDPLLGIHVGEALSRQTWDLMQLSALSAATVRGALALLPRLMPMFNDAVELRIGDDGDGGDVTVEHRVPGRPEGMSRHGNELWVATLLQRAREATGATIRPSACWFGHAAPADPAAVARALGLGEAPAFGAGASGLTLLAGDADRPLRTGDPVLLAVLDRLAAPALAVVDGRRGVAAEVCRRIERGLAEAAPELDDVARAMALSARSLQRELTAAGTSYRELVDQVRRTRARQLLARDLPVDEVAACLGYSERSAFVRAFVRWTGRLPRDG